MLNSLCTAFLVVLVSLFLPAFSQAQAVPETVIQITPRQASSFASAFTELARQAQVAVVAEDQPLHPVLTPQAAAGLKLTKDGEPLSTLLPRLAGAYDYDVQPSGKAFLLKKRYTDAADLPSITVKECVLGLEEASRYAESFNPHVPMGMLEKSSDFSDLIYSLTPDQLEAMKDNKRGVPVTSLTLTQQQEVQQFVLFSYVQRNISDLPTVLAALNRTTADPRFGWRFFPQLNARMFGYDSPQGYEGFLLLSKPDQVKVRVGISVEFHAVQMEGQVPPLTAMRLTSAPDATDPLPVRANAPKPAPPVSASLAEIITRLNTRATDGLKVSVEPYLAPKQATVFGEEAATPRQELAALAEVYSLRVFTEEKEQGKDRLRLTRRAALAPLDVIALHASVLQALPDPLVRAYRKHTDLYSPLYVAAVKQIRTAAEPKIKASKDGRVALSALTEQEGRAFAMTLMVDAMESLSAWTTADVPAELMHFNDLRLAGGLYEKDGKKKMDFMLEFPFANDPGTLAPGMGVGDLNHDPVNHTL